MSFFDDIEKDIAGDIIDSDIVASLYGIYDIMDVHNLTEFIDYIINISCIKEIYNMVINNIDLSDIQKYNSSYNYYNRTKNEIFVTPLSSDGGIYTKIYIIDYNNGKDKTLSFSIIIHRSTYTLSEIDLIYANHIAKYEDVKNELTEKIKKSFGKVNEDNSGFFINHIKSHINNNGIVKYCPAINKYNQDLIYQKCVQYINIHSADNIKDVIDFCIYACANHDALKTFFNKFLDDNNYFTTYIISKYEFFSHVHNAAGYCKVVIDVMKAYQIFNHINIYDFAFSVITYNN